MRKQGNPNVKETHDLPHTRRSLGVEINYRIASTLVILLMNSNCFAILIFSCILVMSVQISVPLSHGKSYGKRILNSIGQTLFILFITFLKFTGEADCKQ